MMEADPISNESREDQPLSGTERLVAQLWREVLQLSRLPDANENFFELGGDSMTMVLTEFRIAEELSVQLPTGAMLGASTVRELAALVEADTGELAQSGDAKSPDDSPPLADGHV